MNNGNGYSKREITIPKSRVPHEVVEAMEAVKEPGESTSQFIIASLEGEIKRRQRKKAKEASE
jgi:hypothetical protein